MLRCTAPLLLALACGRPETTPPEPSRASEPIAADLVIRDVRLFDGERVHERTSVAVARDKIVAVGPELSVTVGAEVVEGAGMTLLPGLIDAHTHIQSGDQLRQALVFGVTTELDMFTLPGLFRTLRRLSADRGRGLADFRTAGILATAPGGHGTEYGFEIPTLTTPAEAQAFVDARLSEGSDYLKIVLDDGGARQRPIPTLDIDVVRALITAAHARGRMAVVHVSSEREAIAAIEVGADGLVHVFGDAAPSERFVRLAAEHKVFVADTLVVLANLCAPGRGPALADDPRLRPLLAPTDLRALAAVWAGRPPNPALCDHARAAVLALHRAGVPILASTDAPNPGTLHGASLHDELALLVDAGLTPAEALRAATVAPADAFRLDDRGRVAVGKRADLVLVRGDPTEAIAATRAITAVWAAGARVDRDARVAEVARQQAEQAAMKAAAPPPGAESGKVSDFEGGDLAVAFGAGWQVSTDAMLGGSSSAALSVVRGAPGTRHALRVAGTVVASETPARWAGAMFFAGPPAAGPPPLPPANLSKFRRIVFRARADAQAELVVMLFASRLGPAPAQLRRPVERRWATYTVELSEFGDTDWYDLTALLFGVTAPGPFAIELDDLRFE